MDFDEIFREYSALVYKYILKLSQSEDVAEDIVQETFYKAVLNAHRFRGECKVSTWLCRIAHNEYHNYLKKKARFDLNIDDFSTLSDSICIEELAENREAAAAAMSALEELRADMRETFKLRLGGLSFREIGDIYGKTENWARVIFFRAKQKIIKRMEEQGYEM